MKLTTQLDPVSMSWMLELYLYSRLLRPTSLYLINWGARGSIVVKALATNRKVACSISDEVTFLIYLILPAALGPGVYSASNRNEYQKQKNNIVSGE
jgi:hypothetical protein